MTLIIKKTSPAPAPASGSTTPAPPTTVNLAKKIEKGVLLVFAAPEHYQALEKAIKYENKSLSTLTLEGVSEPAVQFLADWILSCVQAKAVKNLPRITGGQEFFKLTRLYLVAKQMFLNTGAITSRLTKIEGRFEHLKDIELFYKDTPKPDADDKSIFGQAIIDLHLRVGKSIKHFEGREWFERQHRPTVSNLLSGTPGAYMQQFSKDIEEAGKGEPFGRKKPEKKQLKKLGGRK